MRRAITFVSLVLVAGLLQIGGADAAPPVSLTGDKGVGDPAAAGGDSTVFCANLARQLEASLARVMKR